VASVSVTRSTGADGIAEIHAQELPQKDNLCGCFWGAIVLSAAGIADVDQDRVAVEAGTTLPAGDPATFIPPGEKSRQDYRVPLPTAADSGASGTSAPALARVIEHLSRGELVVIPVAGPWSAESVVGLVEDVSGNATLLANIRSGLLWGTRPDPSILLAYVAGGHVQGPGPEWDTGHYVNLVASIRGGERSLIIVRDSYQSLGWNGYHFQPADAIARALERGDGREGGVLCICSPEDEKSLRAQLQGGGYELRHWNNGTPVSPPP
jgi:hypothetical protein